MAMIHAWDEKISLCKISNAIKQCKEAFLKEESRGSWFWELL